MTVDELIGKLERVRNLYGGDKPISIGLVEDTGEVHGLPFMIDDFGVVATGSSQEEIAEIVLASTEDIFDGYFGKPQNRLGVVK